MLTNKLDKVFAVYEYTSMGTHRERLVGPLFANALDAWAFVKTLESNESEWFTYDVKTLKIHYNTPLETQKELLP